MTDKRRQALPNKGIFKPSMNELAQEAKACLQKRQKIYRDYEVITAFMETLQFVQKLKQQHGPQVASEFCHNLAYFKVQQNQEIITINKESRTFFVVLSGKAGLFVYVQNRQQRSSSLRKSTLLQQQRDSEPFRLQEIKQFEQGDTFGELSILKENSKATATIVTKTVCEFAILTRRKYLDILGNFSKTEYLEKLEYIQTLPCFNNWNEIDLQQLTYQIVQRSYSKGQWVIMEGQENSRVFIIKQGQFCLIKRQKHTNVIVSYLQIGEVYHQVPENPYYDFSIRCLQNDSMMYELTLYDLTTFLEKNNDCVFSKIANERLQWRNNRFINIISINKDQIAQLLELEQTKQAFHSVLSTCSAQSLKSRSLGSSTRKDEAQFNRSESVKKSPKRAFLKTLVPKFKNQCENSDNSIILPCIRKTSGPAKVWVDIVDIDNSFQSLDKYEIGQAESYNLYFQNKPQSRGRPLQSVRKIY